MKIRLSDNPIDYLSDDPVGEYLKSLGISKVDSFLGIPMEEDQESYSSLNNLILGLEMLKKHIDRGSSIFLQVD